MEKTHGRALRRFLAVRMRHATADVPDLVQEVFLRLLRIADHESIRNPQAYLYTVASHVLHQYTLRRTVAAEPIEPVDIASQLDFPLNQPLNGLEGDRLPFNPKFSGNLSIDQEVSFGDDVTVNIGASLTYMGERKNFFFARPARQISLPSYVTPDLRASVTRDNWSTSFYFNNVFDKRNVIIKGEGGSPPDAIFIYTQPRTMGVTATLSF